MPLFLRHLHRVEGFDEGRFAALLEGLDHLHHEFLAAFQQRFGCIVVTHVEPGRRAMAATARVVTHVRRTTETGQATARHGGGMAVAVDLQGCTNEQVHRVLPGQLAEHPIGAQ